ncbi:MAG: hypothetical protein ACP5QG_08925 [candidate division WOR-3 bacterium]
MIHLLALLSFTDMGLRTGSSWNDFQDAEAYATPFTQYARYVLKGNFTSTIRTISIWTGDIDLHGCGPESTTWIQTGFQATNPIGDAKAALTISECQDGYNSYANFNGNFVAYFNGTNPGNHYGHWEGNPAAWMAGGATQATWYVWRYTDGSVADCIAPVISVISVTSTENETYNCVLEAEEGQSVLPGKPKIIRVVPGGIMLSGIPGSSVNLALYDPTGRSEGYTRIDFSRSGESFVPARTGIWFLVTEGFGPVGKAVVW